MYNINQALAEVQNSIQLAGQIQANLAGDDVNTAQDLQSSLQKLYFDVQAVWVSGGPTEQKRIRLAQIRNETGRLKDKVEKIEGHVLQKYREALGDNKEIFESQSLYDQQQNNPKALQLQQTWYLVRQLGDYITDVSTSLMAYSASLEEQYLEQAAMNYTPISNNEVDIADDPAPSHLSP